MGAQDPIRRHTPPGLILIECLGVYPEDPTPSTSKEDKPGSDAESTSSLCISNLYRGESASDTMEAEELGEDTKEGDSTLTDVVEGDETLIGEHPPRQRIICCNLQDVHQTTSQYGANPRNREYLGISSIPTACILVTDNIDYVCSPEFMTSDLASIRAYLEFEGKRQE
ncbi:hypothetical protein QE152_g33226 [Popillia japonica]|uniref:Uncharacterized protein n=1 Tax=Popillia japonica TaxID=7064 RepID=A0AAW1IXD3_POPJA